ncbi:TIGR03862 family flavoprotein [Devosia faecipullorum]|uniref:TIGR03862 family flavoprotein n=1 Tax=Devosia faecipullorum TaxID=2755039 RepID=UPI00187B32F6|nr:TIGR03862 family flavoprotein [Devosia faecipullorum]MBE7733204.1 TIGR03862 family flavoprotein [Devosia faecipullorum]
MMAPRVGIVGGGPAGLIAAEAAAMAGAQVALFDAMPSVGRKLLMAGKSGLNLTHSEEHEALLGRYGAARPRLKAALDAFDGAALRQWCAELGVETFVGSSGRVFPKVMKASPLLRAWISRLNDLGVTFRTRHRWVGFDGAALLFDTAQGRVTERFDAVVLALGGASWPRLGSDGAWASLLAPRGIAIAPMRPANCGFEVAWSPLFVERFSGAPVKAVTATSAVGTLPGEFVVTRWGIEGSLVYAHSAALRDDLERDGTAMLQLDLAPGRSIERLARDLDRQPVKTSFSNRLRKGAGLDGVKLGLVREVAADAAALAADDLARHIKALALPLRRTRPIAEAISTAGGLALDAVDENFMLKAAPGLFVAGEMLDWEAPTGGYLLTACFATGRVAGLAAARFAAN